jgi:hypothetical protein
MSQHPSRPQAAPPEGPERESQGPPLHSVSASNTATPDPGKRSLTPVELQKLQRVFGAGINYGTVCLVRLSRFVTTLNGSRAFVTGTTVNLPESDYLDLQKGRSFSLLVHELTHVWQFQHKGWGYVAEALWAQGFGDGYDYAKALRQGTPWRKMNPEQQAQMIEDAFKSGYFDAEGARFGLRRGLAALIRNGETPGTDFTDYTSVLVTALAELRKAP